MSKICNIKTKLIIQVEDSPFARKANAGIKGFLDYLKTAVKSNNKMKKFLRNDVGLSLLLNSEIFKIVMYKFPDA